MIKLNKKAQVEEFYDDLIAFGLLAILFLLLILFISGLDGKQEGAFDDASRQLQNQEELSHFLRTTSIINDEEMTMYELATKITDKDYADWFTKKLKEYYTEKGTGSYHIKASLYSSQLGMSDTSLISAYFGSEEINSVDYNINIAVPLLKEKYGYNQIIIVVEDW